MSIINEALKKAGQPILTEVKESSKKKKATNWGPFFVIAVLLAITTPLMAPLLRNPYRSGEAGRREMAVGPDLSSQAHVQKQFAIEEAALPRPMSGIASHFALSGLVYSSGGSMCLINGKVMQVGDTVGGAKLVRVTPQGAVLEYRGQEVTLPANV